VTRASLDTITLFVEDLAGSKRFYEEVFGLEVIFEDPNSAVFKFENTLINLLDVTHAGELVVPAAVAGPGFGSRYLLTVNVADVDAACADLQARGIEVLNGPVNRAWGVRTIAFADPGGHVWEFAQQLPR
jgi:lactoylglutathione lyase